MSTFLQAEHQVILRDKRNLLPVIATWIVLMSEKNYRHVIFLEF